MNKPSLIVGIDPGTTLSYCAMDLDGEIILLKSSKTVRFNEMLMELTQAGHVIAVGSDKSKNPELVHRLSAKTGARVVTPKEDMKVEEKRRMANGYATNNAHELDALCACLFAYNELRQLIEKVKERTVDHPKRNLIERLVIRDSMSINGAISELEEKKELPEKLPTGEYPFEKKILSLRNDNHELFEKQKNLFVENSQLKKRIKELTAQVQARESQNKTKKLFQKLNSETQLRKELMELSGKTIVRKYSSIAEWSRDGVLDEKFAIEDAPAGWRGNKKRQGIFINGNEIQALNEVCESKSRNFAIIDLKKAPKIMIIEKIVEEYRARL